MRVDLFDFDLPEDNIALRPASPRDSARLLVVQPQDASELSDRSVMDLPSFLRPGDALVFNDTKVIPAQLEGLRRRGADVVTEVSLTLHMRVAADRWKAFARPAKRLKPGDRIEFGHGSNTCLMGALDATVAEKGEAGEVTLQFDLSGPALDDAILAVGHIPLPPYIASKRAEDEQDRTDYQTVYARERGAVAAPTAGLHFTDRLFNARMRLASSAISSPCMWAPETFLPMKVDDTDDHVMHQEIGHVSAEVAERLNAVRARGGRIVCVGTTSLRLIESAAEENGDIRPWSGPTGIFITPGYRFRAVDMLMTNFHLPKSTLFMLVSAFSGLDTMRRAYAHAIETGYRFYSYGDSSLLFRDNPRDRDTMTETFQFNIQATDGKARRGTVSMPRGEIRTPAFMPVGTVGTVKAMYLDQVRDLGADIILGNTYHLMLRPGPERVARLGGLHELIRWPYPILTDSGGFQVMSLAGLRKLDEKGVTFKSHVDGALHHMSPERSIEIQGMLDSDIQMQLDECVRLPAEALDIERAMEMSLRWADRCKTAFGDQPGKAMFGIVQGGDVPALRVRSAKALSRLDLKATRSAALPSANRRR